MKNTLRAACAAAAFTLAAGAAMAQTDDGGAQIRRYLDKRTEVHAAEGFRRAGMGDTIARFGTETGKVFVVRLQRGVEYRIVGVCDDKCTDMDMEAYDHNGLMTIRDVELNDAPVLNFTAQGAGDHFVRVWLANCDNEDGGCAVGVRVLRK